MACLHYQDLVFICSYFVRYCLIFSVKLQIVVHLPVFIHLSSSPTLLLLQTQTDLCERYLLQSQWPHSFCFVYSRTDRSGTMISLSCFDLISTTIRFLDPWNNAMVHLCRNGNHWSNQIIQILGWNGLLLDFFVLWKSISKRNLEICLK